MKAGEKKMLYGGNPLETSGELEIVNGRAFLPMRDWAKIFGAEKILWNDETKTATLKGAIRKTAADKQENIGKGRLLGTIDALFRLKIKTFLQNGKEPFHFDKI